MDIVIFGAQGIALGTYEAIKTIYPNRDVRCFLVSSRGINPEYLEGIPVKEIADYSDKLSDEEKKLIKVMIATPEDVQCEIAKTLECYGFHNYCKVDSLKYAEIMALFHEKKGRFAPLSSLPVGENNVTLKMFMARHEKDKVLCGQYTFPDYVESIQVGAETATKIICNTQDNTGDNISLKNCNYSELSGLYWIWKNELVSKRESGSWGYEYYGLEQYRRVLIFDDEDISKLKKNDVDVVLPYPMPYYPDINAHHERYLKLRDWEALLQAMEEIHPEYYLEVPKVMSQRYFYNYNIILARGEVLLDYCHWLFPILERIEMLSDPKGVDRSDRYIGYMGETLETIYFMVNKTKLNIAHVGCRMLV